MLCCCPYFVDFLVAWVMWIFVIVLCYYSISFIFHILFVGCSLLLHSFPFTTVVIPSLFFPTIAAPAFLFLFYPCLCLLCVFSLRYLAFVFLMLVLLPVQSSLVYFCFCSFPPAFSCSCPCSMLSLRSNLYLFFSYNVHAGISLPKWDPLLIGFLLLCCALCCCLTCNKIEVLFCHLICLFLFIPVVCFPNYG